MKEKALRDAQIRSMHEMGEKRESKNYQLTKSQCKVKRKSSDNTKAHFSVAGNARTHEFFE